MTSEFDLKAYYDRNVSYYSPLRDTGAFTDMLSLVGVSPPDSVLDVGCGDGRLLDHINPTWYVGVDYSYRRIELATRNHKHRCFIVSELVPYLEQFNGARVDVAVAVEVLEHLEEPELVVGLMRGVSRFVLATVPVNLPDRAHLQVYEDVEDVKVALAPDVVASFGVSHWVLGWEGDK
jgi:2-polyprenyl-3-methyl-5-hydroxy-6-metoxy-1,4-benzoquinol methylase